MKSMFKTLYSRDEERREQVRVHYQTKIIIEADAATIQLDGSSRDLSLGGVFVNTDKKILLNTRCKVKILLSGLNPPLFLEIDGKIVRTDASGIAIAFESMDLDSYTHLKNIVRYNATHPDFL
jgi:hypothetical protein